MSARTPSRGPLVALVLAFVGLLAVAAASSVQADSHWEELEGTPPPEDDPSPPTPTPPPSDDTHDDSQIIIITPTPTPYPGTVQEADDVYTGPPPEIYGGGTTVYPGPTPAPDTYPGTTVTDTWTLDDEAPRTDDDPGWPITTGTVAQPITESQPEDGTEPVSDTGVLWPILLILLLVFLLLLMIAGGGLVLTGHDEDDDIDIGPGDDDEIDLGGDEGIFTSTGVRPFCDWTAYVKHGPGESDRTLIRPVKPGGTECCQVVIDVRSIVRKRSINRIHSEERVDREASMAHAQLTEVAPDGRVVPLEIPPAGIVRVHRWLKLLIVSRRSREQSDVRFQGLGVDTLALTSLHSRRNQDPHGPRPQQPPTPDIGREIEDAGRRLGLKLDQPRPRKQPWNPFRSKRRNRRRLLAEAYVHDETIVDIRVNRTADCRPPEADGIWFEDAKVESFVYLHKNIACSHVSPCYNQVRAKYEIPGHGPAKVDGHLKYEKNFTFKGELGGGEEKLTIGNPFEELELEVPIELLKKLTGNVHFRLAPDLLEFSPVEHNGRANASWTNESATKPLPSPNFHVSVINNHQLIEVGQVHGELDVPGRDFATSFAQMSAAHHLHVKVQLPERAADHGHAGCSSCDQRRYGLISGGRTGAWIGCRCVPRLSLTFHRDPAQSSNPLPGGEQPLICATIDVEGQKWHLTRNPDQGVGTEYWQTWKGQRAVPTPGETRERGSQPEQEM